MTTQERLKYLLDQYASHEATENEVNELFNVVRTSEHDDFLRGWLAKTIATVEPAKNYDRKRWDKVLAESLQQAKDEETNIGIQNDQQRGRILSIPRSWKRWAIAASVLLIAGAGVYFLFFNKAEKRIEIVDKPTIPDDVRPPATNRAMVTLADGRVVYLDSIGNGELAMENGVKLVKLADGRIVYEIAQFATRNDPSTDSGQAMVWNTLSNPRGSRVIDMMLSDGSHVWLNAGSSVTYPVAFNGSERRVSVTGEAYFEVNSLPLSGGKKMPFIVSKGDIQVEVLGTHFNVNAYEDETDVKVTLLEGSVRTTISPSKGSGGESSILKPGEQAVIRDRIKVVKGVDADEVMAWKNGRFVFGEKADIQTIMRQIARWYDVEVEYRGTIRNHFGGSISRQVNVSEVFRVLEATGGVKCKVEGRKVIVMP